MYYNHTIGDAQRGAKSDIYGRIQGTVLLKLRWRQPFVCAREDVTVLVH
jgi:hypothetical protein